MSGSPRRVEGTDLGHDRRDVVGGPLLADLAVGDPVDVHRVPPDRRAVGLRPEQASFDRGGDDEPDDDQVILGDDVLLGRMQVWRRPDERPQQAGQVRRAGEVAEPPPCQMTASVTKAAALSGLCWLNTWSM